MKTNRQVSQENNQNTLINETFYLTLKVVENTDIK